MTYDPNRVPQDNSEWNGHFTLASAQGVHDRMKRMLGEGQPFTFVSAYEGRILPEVRTSLTLSALDLYLDEERAQLSIRTSWGSHGLLGRFADQAAVYDHLAHEEGTRTCAVLFSYRKVEIMQYNSFSARLSWVLALEERPEVAEVQWGVRWPGGSGLVNHMAETLARQLVKDELGTELVSRKVTEWEWTR